MRLVLRACPKRPCTPQAVRAIRSQSTAFSQHRFRSDNTAPDRNSNASTAGPEAPPFHGYLIDALDAPLGTLASATKTAPSPPPPENPPQSPEEEKIAKARVVFGSRLAGPAERKREIDKLSEMVAGVKVPPRPEEPDNCCMSGCVNCVWDLYREELEEWAEKKGEADAKMRAQREAAGSMDDDGVGNWDVGEGGLFEGIPVGIREFMRTEKVLKERHRAEGSAGG